PAPGPRAASSEQGFAGGDGAEVGASQLGDDAPAWRPLDEPELKQVRLVHVLDRVPLLAERDCKRRQPDRPATETLDDRAQQLAVDAFEPLLVDLVQLERLARDLNRHDALVSNLGDVAHAPQDAVGDTRSPARAARDFGRRDVRDLDVEDPRGAEGDRRQLVQLVVAEPEGHAEAVAE